MADSGLPAEALVGRTTELERIRTFLADARESGESLALVGKRGVGRTAVAEAASEMATTSGATLLTVDGHRAGPPWSSALGALMSQLDDGRTEGAGSERGLLARGNELLSRLAAASRTGPLLVVLDDGDLLDEQSLSVLAFVGRRLATTRAGLLITTRPDESVGLRRRGLPELELPPLTAVDATELLLARFPDVARGVAVRLVTEAGGSPLALLELAAALGDRQRSGLDPLPTVLTLTDRLRSLYDAPLEGLSPTVLEVLVTVSLARPGDLDSLTDRRPPSASDLPGSPFVSGEALREAEELGLVELDPIGLRAPVDDPLSRAAVRERAGQEMIRRAHRRLAAALVHDPDRRTWHLASGLSRSDSGVGAELEQVALRAARAGEVDEAVNAMILAADHCGTGAERGARLAAAAQLQASVAGDLQAAAQLLAEASTTSPDSSTISGAVATAQLMVAQDAHLRDIRRLLTTGLHLDPTLRAVDEDGVPKDPVILAAFQLLFFACLMEARTESWRAYHRLLRDRRPHRDRSLELLDGVLPDISRTSASTLADLDLAITDLTGSVDAGEVIRVSVAAFHLDRVAGCRSALWRLAEDARNGQSVSFGAQAMLRLSLDSCLTGQLAAAEELAVEGQRLSTALGHREHEWPFQLCLALVAAARGDDLEVDRLTRLMAGWAIPRGALLVEQHCAHVRALVALGDEDFESAYQLASSVSSPGTLSSASTVGLWVSFDLIEAAVHTGRSAEAAAHAAALVEADVARLSPRLALRVAGGVALAASDSEAAQRFEEGLAIRHADRWPFEVARVELAYGGRLRRLGAPAAAHEHLWTAHETFRRLGARSWAHRAARQLRAAGLGMPVHERPPTEPLTGRDREIALLAAAGLSNQEIGAKLFLSPRTVGSRLYRIFPKLGVSSRAALREALQQDTSVD